MTYKVKIEAWDEESKSLIVKFASDKTASSNPDDYDAGSLQPATAFSGFTNVEDIKRELGLHAKANADMQAAMELAESSIDEDMYKSWVGQTFEFTDLDLQPVVSDGEVKL